MHSLEIKKKYIEYFKQKKHKEIPNVSLLPENDPTSLFIMAGMQPLINHFSGEPHPTGKRLVNIQRCVRTNDIEEVGDTIHMTFFEMLGNWSLGDYFKKEAITLTWEFLTEVLGFDPNRIYVTIFEGDEDAPFDSEAVKIWKSIYDKVGIKAEVFDKSKKNTNARIFPLPKKENWWGPVGDTGPCGPDSELFYWRGKQKPDFDKFVPWDTSNMFIEIGNNVFIQYDKQKDNSFKELKQRSIDFGGGFERITLVTQLREKDGAISPNLTIFNTDLFDTPKAYLRSLIEDESKESTLEENKYTITEFDPTLTELHDIQSAVKSFRVILDHMRACTFLIAEGIEPSNKDQGYILRRLIRRAARHAKLLNIKQNFTKDMAELYIEKYKVQYPHLDENSQKIIDILDREEINFEKTIQRGKGEIDKLEGTGKKITGKNLFYIYETYGFPIEMALDELGIIDEEKRKLFEDEFKKAQKEHQIKSREGAKGKFTGGLADHSNITTRYHTATHLLLKALQVVLGDHVHQRGSNITQERLRFDFSHPEKLTDKQRKETEDIVNEKIEAGCKVGKEIISKKEALKIGAEHEFDRSYPDKVSVYFIKEKNGKIFSKEFCGGPHVETTKDLTKSGRFKIIKEESSGSGIRRIKAVLEK